ncbi:MAG: large conductance mechanosensitive channel protein MscL [Candidatus Nanopelagicales bacterium]
MLKGFKDFILRGNVIDLAVAVVIGAAFTALVTAVTAGLIQPIINMVFGLIGIGTDGIGGTIALPEGQTLNLGLIVTAVITFVITAAVVYFVFVAPMNAAKSRFTKTAEEELAEDTALLREIRDLLKDQNSEVADLRQAVTRD